MGIFDRFKKDKPGYDATNIKVNDLDKGFVFDYDLSTWIVKNVYEYDWGDNNFTKEFKIENGSETSYLSIEHDDELIISISNKERLSNIDPNLPDYIVNHKTPPSKIEFKEKIFILENENPGYFNDWDESEDEWTELISWEFIDEKGEFILCIEQWGERQFEASYGKFIKEFEISNINPSN